MVGLLHELGWFGRLLFILFVVVAALAHVAFAIAVLIDMPRRRVLLPTPVWALATLFGGVFVASLYYVMHYATWIDDGRAAHPVRINPPPGAPDQAR